MKGFRLTSLTIKNCKLIKPPLTLNFSDGENILLGLNGSGKTTLLNIFTDCLNSTFIFLRSNENDFHVEYTLVNENTTVIIDYEYVYKKKEHQSDLNKKFIIKDDKEFEYQVHIDIKTKHEHYKASWNKNSLSVTGNHHFQTEGINDEATQNVLTIFNGLEKISASGNKELKKITDNLYSYFLTNLPNSSRFPESLDSYNNWQNNSNFQLLLENKKISYYDDYIPFLKDFDHILKNNLPKKSRLSDSYTVTAKEYPFLQTIADKLNYQSIRIDFQFDNKNVDDDMQVILTWKGFRIFIDINENTTITYDKLSHGEKRFVILMLYLHSNEHAVVVDEILNGLHHSMIMALLDEMEGKQSFLAVQNPMMLDYAEFNSADDVKKKLIFCNCEKEGMFWRNPTDEESQELFAEIEKDFLHTSEILRHKQLW